jgi:cell division transport system permease protein
MIGLFRRATDIPLDRDRAARTLPWIMAVMVFLASLALAGAMILSGVIQRWSTNLSGTLTVQVPAAPTAEETTQRLNRVVAVLREIPGIARVRVLTAGESSALVEPWLGRETGALGLPLPRLVDVGLAPGASIDLPALRKRLEAIAPAIAVEDHQKWLEEALSVVRWGWMLALGVVFLIVVAAGMTIVFAARTSLRIHRAVTEVLHLIGARDEYIAGQFQNHALRMGLFGGAVGGGLAALTLFGLGRLVDRIETLQGLKIGLSPMQWGALALVPLGAGLLAAAAARYTVLGGLARMR